MAIRLKPNGDIEADSLAEFLEVHRHLQKTNGSHAPRTETPKDHTDGNASTPAVLSDAARKMLKYLLAKRDWEDTVAIAKEIDVSGPKGLASPTAKIRAWAAAQFALGADCIEKDAKPNSNGAWTHYSKLSDALIQRVKGREKEFGLT
jgi:hypothetical protein